METGKKARGYVAECADISLRYPKVSLIQGMLIGTEITGCMLRGEYLEAIEASMRGSKILLDCKGVSQTVLSVLALNRVECTIMLNDFQSWPTANHVCQEAGRRDPINDLALSDYAIRLGLRTENYEFAYRQFTAVSQRKISRFLTPRSQENWLILEACINFLVCCR